MFTLCAVSPLFRVFIFITSVFVFCRAYSHLLMCLALIFISLQGALQQLLNSMLACFDVYVFFFLFILFFFCSIFLSTVKLKNNGEWRGKNYQNFYAVHVDSRVLELCQFCELFFFFFHEMFPIILCKFSIFESIAFSLHTEKKKGNSKKNLMDLVSLPWAHYFL